MHEILYKLQREIAEGVGGLSTEGTQARRGPEKWNIQQIVEHLTLSYIATIDVVEARLAKGTPTKGSPSLMQTAGQVMITTLGIFPRGRKAPPPVTPREVTEARLSGEDLNAGVADLLTRMDASLMRAETLFGPTRKAVSHIVLGPMSIDRWRRFHLAHGEHHVRQILATRRAPQG